MTSVDYPSDIDEAVKRTDSLAALRALVFKDPIVTCALVILLFHIVLAIVAPLIVPYPPNDMNYGATLQPPSLQHWFGTDRYGRDVLSRVFVGGQITMIFGIGSVLICLAIGIPAGLTAAYFGGYIDQIIMRGMDILMSFPTVLLALLVMIIAGPDLTTLTLAIGLVYCPRTTRVVRSAAISLHEAPFVEAARARGESSLYVMMREILPVAWGPIIVEICIRLGYAILLGASLNYLGLGVQPPEADWGALVYEARPQMMTAPWIVLFPILFIVSLVASLHLVGDGIDAMLKEGMDA
ncbi:MAG: ABC transporter permease [Pseudorhodoplanes sp.]